LFLNVSIKIVILGNPYSLTIQPSLWQVRQQRKLYDKSKKTGSDEDQNKYKLARRNNKRIFRKMEQEHYNRVLFEPLARGDSKPSYSFYKRKSGNYSRGSLVFKNKTLFETSEIFNEYFQSVFSKTDSYSIALETTESCPIKVTSDGVLKLLKELKNGKASGPNMLRKEDICLNLEITSKIMSKIFQYSLDIRQLPDI